MKEDHSDFGFLNRLEANCFVWTFGYDIFIFSSGSQVSEWPSKVGKL